MRHSIERGEAWTLYLLEKRGFSLHDNVTPAALLCYSPASLERRRLLLRRAAASLQALFHRMDDSGGDRGRDRRRRDGGLARHRDALHGSKID